jgi:hypothetical protein
MALISKSTDDLDNSNDNADLSDGALQSHSSIQKSTKTDDRDNSIAGRTIVKSVVEQWKDEGENVSVDVDVDRGGKSVQKVEIAKPSVRDKSTGAILVITP